MDFMAPIHIQPLQLPIQYGENIFLIGSCFTEHIGNVLAAHKFNVLQNPGGILFDPYSVCDSIISYIENRQYTKDDLFYYNELWQTWQHHSRFANINAQAALQAINIVQKSAHDFLKTTDKLIITLGSAFSYRLTGAAANAGRERLPVANCHRAPGQWFNKYLMPVDEIIAGLDTVYHRLKIFNPGIQIIFTISPVRHLRDGVVENNRSKARLIEAVHHIVTKFDNTYYFPAYELVIDVLRDYRFFDIDLAHPNYAATEFVMQHFTKSCIGAASVEIMQQVKQIFTAKNHRPMQPDTSAHRHFRQIHLQKAQQLVQQYPFLNMEEEVKYFSA